MCSTRNRLTCLGVVVMPIAAFAVLATSGCQRVTTPPPMAVNTAPIVVDEAMLRRDFEPVTAYHANGVTIAGPTGVYFEPKPDLPPTVRSVIEVPLFVGHTVMLPFDMIWDPWWEDVAYPRGQAPPSYTAAPPSDTQY